MWCQFVEQSVQKQVETQMIMEEQIDEQKYWM